MKRLKDPCTGKEIWKLTDEPAVNITHQYHNVDAFSADGCYVAYGINQKQVNETPTEPEVAVYDLAEQRERGRHPGSHQAWNPTRPELVFNRDGAVYAWNIESDTVRKVADLEGVQVGSVDRTGQWALVSYEYGVTRSRIDRVALDGSGKVETLLEAGGDGLVSSPRANPTHDVCHVRFYGPKPGEPVTWYRGKKPRGDLQARYMMIVGTDGSNPHPVSPYDEWGHHNWSGDGEWYMLGTHWKRWNAPREEPWQPWAPLPVGFNHQGHCGRDGRLIVGDFGDIYTYIFNLQTHELTLMDSAMSASVPYSKNADPHPIGSPDGTKYVFDSMYDLERAPVTRLAAGVRPVDVELPVESTEGFPDRGHVVIGYPGCGPEVIAYEAKDDTRFLRCRRGSPPAVSEDTPYTDQVAGATPTRFGRGVNVTAYDGLHLGPGKRREPDVHIQVVRPPEHPRRVRAERGGNGVLVSWEAPPNCREICKHEVWRREGDEAWSRVGETAVAQNQFEDPNAPAGPLSYAVASVEHSGLTSEKSATAVVASRDGSALPGEVLLPIGEADQLIGRYQNPEVVLFESMDDRAYNHRAIIMHHGASHMTVTFTLPKAAAGLVEVHARCPGAAAYVRGTLNGTAFYAFVDRPEYGWVPVTLDEQDRPAALPLNEGDNTLTLGGPAERLYMDCVRVVIQDAGGDRS